MSMERTESKKPGSSSSTPSFNESRWVNLIRRTLEEEHDGEEEEDENDENIPVSIFNVPRVLLASDPESYTPQEVAIGPYHYLRSELYEMERHKLSSAKRAQKSLLLPNKKLLDIAKKLMKYDRRVRACYHKYLEPSEETLAWMMVIDASFLLEFLRFYDRDELNLNLNLVTRLQKSAREAILKDLVMLENQIPAFVLRKSLEFRFETLESADQALSAMLLGFCRDISPFKSLEEDDDRRIQVSNCSHLLDFLYRTVTPPEIFEEQDQDMIILVEIENDEKGHNIAGEESAVKKLIETMWKILSKLYKGPIIRVLKRVIFSKPLKVLLKLPWTILSNLPGLRAMREPVEMFFSKVNEEKAEEENDDPEKVNKPPSVEEIAIPSVTELVESGVNFRPTNGNVSTVSFDPKSVTFYLPSVTLEVNTEAILRNLVAYEASRASGPLIFTRYTELMNGIIDAEEDVRLLREQGIIVNRLKSDGEAAEVWNGMSKSVRLTKVPFLDKAIEEVNKYHDGRWKVKFGKFMKRYVFGSWKFLTLLATILMLLFTGLQAFCSVYSCARIIDNVGNAT